jgi:hypothetical protein
MLLREEQPGAVIQSPGALREGISLPSESHLRSSACIRGWPKARSCGCRSSSPALYLRLAQGLSLSLLFRAAGGGGAAAVRTA